MYSQQESFAGTPLWTGDNAIRQFEVTGTLQYTTFYIVTRGGEVWTWGYHDAIVLVMELMLLMDTFLSDFLLKVWLEVTQTLLLLMLGFTTTGEVYGSSGHGVVRLWSGGGYSNVVTVYMSVSSDDNYEDYDYAKVRPASDSLSSSGVTTCVGTGYNASRELSLGASSPATTFDDDYSAQEGNAANVDDQQNLFVGMTTTAGYQMKDVTEFSVSKSESNYTQGIIRCVHQNKVVHYLLPYTKAAWTSDTEDASYNVVQDQDPQGLASNYVAKPIPLFPTGELANDQTYINVVAIDGTGSGNTSFVVIDQRSGTMYYVGNYARLSYGLFGLNGTEYGIYQHNKFLYH